MNKKPDFISLSTMKKKAFTLAEILIVLVLFGLLAGIILQTYTTISQVSFRIHQEKQIAKEALLLSQVLENLAQDHTIDYDKYSDRQDIQKSEGILETLYLKNNNGDKVQISSTCGKNNEEIISATDFMTIQNLEPEKLAESENLELWEKIKKADCKLTMKTADSAGNFENQEPITLLDSNNFLMTKFQFKILPYIGIEAIKKTRNNENNDNNLPPLAQPGFQISGILYSKFYHPHKRSNNIALPLQLFFTLGENIPSLYATESTTDDQTN